MPKKVLTGWVVSRLGLDGKYSYPNTRYDVNRPFFATKTGVLKALRRAGGYTAIGEIVHESEDLIVFTYTKNTADRCPPGHLIAKKVKMELDDEVAFHIF